MITSPPKIKKKAALLDCLFSNFIWDLTLRDFHHVLGLRPFWTVGYFELNFLALDQGFVPITANGAVMNENILFAWLLDKSVALCVVKPFDLADSF